MANMECQSTTRLDNLADLSRTDIPGIETLKLKRRIAVNATRCISCGIWECPEYDRDKYDVEIIGETRGLCESCRKAIKWAKEQMKGGEK